jgi:hypothetical protein
MDAKAGFYALAVSAALVMASGAMLTNDAMAQADDVTVQGDAAPVQTDANVEAAAQADDVAAEVDEAPVESDVAAVQDDVVDRPVPMQKPAAAERPAKSNLNQSAVRAAPVKSSPRPTRTSTRAIALPKILGSYR